MIKAFVEICTGSLDDALTVEATGWKDIELNSALPLGGLTPSFGLLSAVREQTNLNIVAMCRPRPGGFCYSVDEWLVLMRDAETLLANGAHGIALGVLTSTREIDRRRLDELKRTFSDATLVFHRAFDLTVNLENALETLIDCGVTRVLTSGGALSAWDGRERLKSLVTQAGNRIEILLGSGVKTSNCVELLELTGSRAIHGSFSSPVSDPGYLDGPFRFAPNDDVRFCDKMQLLELQDVLSQASA